MLTGGCFCGQVRYEIDDGDYLAANCHCSMCRRAHAAAFVTWLVVPAARFRYSGATPSSFQSSERGTRYFCSRCGTQLACVVNVHPDIIDVAVGALDAPHRHAPTVDVHTDTRLHWLHA